MTTPTSSEQANAIIDEVIRNWQDAASVAVISKRIAKINGETMDDGVDEPEYPPSETPRTDNEICLDSDGNAVMWRGENVVTAAFARKLELQTKDQQAAFNGQAVGRILKHIEKICGECGGEITAVGCAQCWKQTAQKMAAAITSADHKMLDDAYAAYEKQVASAEPSNGLHEP